MNWSRNQQRKRNALCEVRFIYYYNQPWLSLTDISANSNALPEGEGALLHLHNAGQVTRQFPKEDNWLDQQRHSKQVAVIKHIGNPIFLASTTITKYT